MNTPPNSFSEASGTLSDPTSRSISGLQRFYWSVRRELWENRSIYIAPLATGGVVLLGFLLLAFRLGVADFSSANTESRHQGILFPYHVAAGLIMFAAGIVSLFYCLDALHGERRDRSVLFWKSVPVSDLITVLAKASVPLLILPLVAWAVTVATQFLILLLSSVLRLGGPGSTGASIWSQANLLAMSGMLFYHLFAVHSLWYAPLYGWLLVVSAWARRATFLWAFLPPLAVVILEKIVFNTSHFADMLHRRFTGGMEAAAVPGSIPIDPGMHITLGRYLSTPGLWLGLLVTAVFLATAVQLRRYREAL